MNNIVIKSKKFKISKKIILILSFSLCASQILQAMQCHDLFANKAASIRKSEIENDLNTLYWLETLNRKPEEVEQMNLSTFNKITADIPPSNTHRKKSLSLAEIKKVHQSIMDHPVVSPLLEKYEHDDVSVGYCFGRATYVHLKLLSLGVQKESIQKIWAVGQMQTQNIVWQFHVATMVYNSEKGWMVIDSNFNNPITVKDWMSTYWNQSTDHKLRFYNTDPSKFGLSLGYYDAVNMGLNLSRDQDWYKHYFKDMLNEFRKEARSKVLMQKTKK
ncbi:MAG: protein-glutamine glutaminase family protein [Pseudobdellovibrio sp.]